MCIPVAPSFAAVPPPARVPGSRPEDSEGVWGFGKWAPFFCERGRRSSGARRDLLCQCSRVSSSGHSVVAGLGCDDPGIEETYSVITVLPT